MTEILDLVERWRANGRNVALATVIGVERSAPRAPGAVLALNDAGEVAGSVSGGCVESEVVEEARAVLAGAKARVVSYGITDEQAVSHGLTCGGTIHVLVERCDW